MDDTVTLIGKVVMNLSSLEFMLRISILRARGQESTTTNLNQIEIGQVVKKDPLTDYSSLGKNIDRYNPIFRSIDKATKSRILLIRDAMAHGRMWASNPNDHFKLIKFGKSDKKGNITVKAIIEMTPKWLNESVNFLASKIRELDENYRKMKP